MNRYAEYKDSGVEEICEIPAAWDLKKLTFVTSSIGSGTTPKSDNDQYYQDGTIPWLITGDLNDGNVSIVSNKINTLAIEDYPALKAWPARSLAIAMYGATIGKVGLLQFPTTVNQANCVFVFNGENCPRFWLYVLLANRSRIVSMRYGGGQPNISQEILKSLRFACPQKEEQSLISAYLDKKTSHIDSLIEKIAQKIKLLKEQRTSLIVQCVTKGLDPNVEMKNSGVEWIGEIPSHWDTKRLASFGSFYKGKRITKGDLRVIGRPCILYSQIYTSYDHITAEVDSYIEQRLFDHSIKVTKEIFLFTCSGETADEIGKCLLYYGDEEISIGGDIVAYKLQPHAQFDPIFLSFVFNCSYSKFFKASNSRGEIVVHIYKNQLRELRVVFPGIEEQIEIGQYLNKMTSQIDSLSEKLRRKIELLKEYRQSLISNVVTGKVKVTKDAS